MARDESQPEFWALMWREKDDWGWLCSLDGNRECTTQDAAKRLRYYSVERAKSAMWRFRADNPKRDGERISVVHVRVKGAGIGWRCECVIEGGGRADGRITKACPAHARWLAREKSGETPRSAQPTIDAPSIMRAAGYDEGVKAEREAIAWWLDDFARGQDQHVGIPFGDLLRECARRVRLRGTSGTKAQ